MKISFNVCVILNEVKNLFLAKCKQSTGRSAYYLMLKRWTFFDPLGDRWFIAFPMTLSFRHSERSEEFLPGEVHTLKRL